MRDRNDVTEETALDEGDLEEIRDLLSPLEEVTPPPSGQLVNRTMERVNDELTGRDLIDLTTSVMVLRFFVPILELVMGTVHESLKRKNHDD